MRTGHFLSAVALSLLQVLCASAQTSAPPAPSSSAATAPGAKAFSEQELEQLLAPIALYPDALLAQILMASTYPLEVVQAEKWVKANPGLKDKALEDALQSQTWDPSVKSLAVFPEVLTMMSDKIDWTQKLGDAFLAQQKEVLAAAQKLRNKALAQGNLKDSKEQKVSTEQTGATTTVKIEPTNPDVVYVPTYNPTVVYGAWPYPSYPPATYYPPGYAYTPGAALFTFAAGAAVGAALWGNCNWGAGDVNVNVNRYNTFNRSNVTNANWSHNAAHRGAVPYRSQNVAQQYGRAQNRNVASREQFRGRAQAGQSAIQRGEVPRSAAASRGGADRANVASARGAGSTRSAATNRSQSTRNSGMGSTAFDTGRASQARDFSSRGSSSLSAARSSGNFGGSTQARSFGGGSAGSSSFGSGRAGGGSFGGGAGGARGGGGRGGGGRR